MNADDSLGFAEQQQQVNTKLLITGCLLLAGWLFLPFLAWVAGVFIYAFAVQKTKLDSAIVFFVVFSLSVLIASRHIGYLWGGADDMPSYLMAYERYSSFSSMLPTSLLYAKHADFLFALYSWVVASLTNNHSFLYYFITLAVTYLLIWKFCKLVDNPSPLLCFLMIVFFYKFFQSQWHLIRACMAVPILLYGIWYSQTNKKHGIAIFFLGSLMHFSTSFLLLPLLIFSKHLNRRWNIEQLILLILGFVFSAIFGVLAIKGVGSVINHYMINKILTRLVFEPSFSKLPSLLFFIFVTIIALPGYIKTTSPTYIRLFNMMSFLTLLSFIALFFIGDELHRILLPLYLLYAPLMLLAFQYITPKLITGSFLFLVIAFHMAAFSYVLLINESNFFYQDEIHRHPIENKGLDYFLTFKHYSETDITYYDGYRNK